MLSTHGALQRALGDFALLRSAWNAVSDVDKGSIMDDEKGLSWSFVEK